MSTLKKTNEIISNPIFKNVGLLVLGSFMIFSTVLVFIVSPRNFFLSIHYIRGYGGYGVPIIGFILGMLLFYYGLKGMLKKQ